MFRTNSPFLRWALPLITMLLRHLACNYAPPLHMELKEGLPILHENHPSHIVKVFVWLHEVQKKRMLLTLQIQNGLIIYVVVIHV